MRTNSMNGSSQSSSSTGDFLRNINQTLWDEAHNEILICRCFPLFLYAPVFLAYENSWDDFRSKHIWIWCENEQSEKLIIVIQRILMHFILCYTDGLPALSYYSAFDCVELISRGFYCPLVFIRFFKRLFFTLFTLISLKVQDKLYQELLEIEMTWRSKLLKNAYGKKVF